MLTSFTIERVFALYRPTVRYSDVYRAYVDDLFHATTLDRNQIIRAALFVAGHSKEFNEILKDYKKGDVPTPSWSLSERALWLESNPKREERKDVNDHTRGKTSINAANERGLHKNVESRQDEGRERAFSSRTEKGGITITIG
ncbi:hypothetical protein AAEO50_12330 [Rossellomorea oryzaecorticis]|uniref:Reverse transcriptase n=1 Tax=Rossellomorea oryzaecorticis TaxID=1396505 RepID=A0ABU9KAE7_9BACI